MLSVLLGDLSFVLPSSVTPLRNSRNTVTTRRISSSAGASAGNSRTRPICSTRRSTISTSSSSVPGKGSTTVLKRRFNALESSFTPRSRLLAVAIRLKPFTAWTSLFSSGIGNDFSDRIEISVSCTSEGILVNSSTRAIFPACIASLTGPGTSAFVEGPSANRRA